MKGTEFEEKKNGDLCRVIRGKEKGKICVVLHKETAPFKSKVVLVKPANNKEKFDSETIAYRYFKLFSYTELAVVQKEV